MLINFNKRSSSSSSAHASNESTSNGFSCINHVSDDVIQSTRPHHHQAVISSDDTIQIEESRDDCVYQITIKKVYNQNLKDDKQTKSVYGTYRPLSNNFFSYVNVLDQANTNPSGSATKDGLIYTRVKIRQLKYASLPKLIEHLTNEETGFLDMNLVQVFLVTYRTFTDTVTALRLIRARYEQILPASLEMTEDVRLEHLKSFCGMLYMWLDNYIEDFNEPPEYVNLNMLNNFVQKHMRHTELIQLIQSKYELFEALATSSQATNSSGRSGGLLSVDLTNQMQTSFASTSQFSISPASTSSQSSASRPLTTQTTAHRRSCSSNNFIQTDLNLTSTSYLNHSKSQNNLFLLNGGGTNKSPILNMFGRKGAANLVNSMNNSQLMEASFMQIDSTYFAEQLTFIDKCLFPKVCAHLCLGGVWSTRYKKNANEQTGNGDVQRVGGGGASSPTALSLSSTNSTPILSDKFASIGAFIDQFNCVSFVVQATILENVELRAAERAKIVKKWIEIAQACLLYKNFSSLNAIVQGLNTQCVSRLEKTWCEVPS